MPRPSKSAQLLKSAGQLLDLRPYRDITLDDVAAHAGVTRGLIIYHFETRENFFLEVARATLHEDMQLFGPAPEPGQIGWLEHEIEIFIKMTRAHYLRTQAINIGMAGIEGIIEVTDEMNNFTAARVIQYFGADPDNPLLFGILRAWGRACVDVALRGIPEEFVTDDQLKRIMVAHVYAVVEAALAEPLLGT